MPTLHCACGVSLNIPSLEGNEALRCPKCGQNLKADDSQPLRIVIKLPNRDEALALFREQCKTILTNWAADWSSLFSKKSAASLLESFSDVLSVYEHNDMLFPCIHAELEMFKSFKFILVPKKLYTELSARTGTGGLTGTIDELSDLRRAGYPDPDERRAYQQSNLICAKDGCKTDLSAERKVKICPRCQGNLGILLFHLAPQDFSGIPVKEDGNYYGLVIEQDGLVFQSDKPQKKILYADAGLINVHFWQDPGPFRSIMSGKLHIRIFDKNAKCIYETYSRQKFSLQDFQSFVAMLSGKATNVRIFDTTWNG